MAVTKKPKADEAELDLSYINEHLHHLAVPIDQVKPDPANARVHSPINLQEIRGSLLEFGWDQPIVANAKTGLIVKGEGRWLSAKDLGHSMVPVVWVDEAEPDSVARGIADNAAHDTSKWGSNLIPALKKARSAKDAGVRSMFARLAELTNLEDSLFEDDEVTKELDTETAVAPKTEPAPEVPGMDLRPYEHYDYVLVLARNVHDWNMLCTVLGLEQKTNKVGRVIGLGRAVDARKLLDLVEDGKA